MRKQFPVNWLCCHSFYLLTPPRFGALNRESESSGSQPVYRKLFPRGPHSSKKRIIVRLLFDGFCAYHRISFAVSIMFFAKKSRISSTEYAAFCYPLSCQESFDFIFGNLEAYCQGVEDEQTRDAAREF